MERRRKRALACHGHRWRREEEGCCSRIMLHGVVRPLGFGALATETATAQVVEEVETVVAEGYTMTQFCDKMIEVLLNEKAQTNDWRKLLAFREEWKKYRERFYRRCQERASAEKDQVMKDKLATLSRKLKRIDDEMEIHEDLLKQIRENPRDLNLIVAARRKDFNGGFFNHLNIIAEMNDGLEERDEISRLSTRCLSAVSAYDNAAEDAEVLNAAQSKFDDILNSSSLDEACEKISSLAKAKELDSTLILLINRAWATAKESTTMNNEVKEIMYHIYKTTKSSLKSIVPKEIKLLKYLLNITDPEERFSALATAFSPGDEHEAKVIGSLHTTPKELHKWVTIMLDAYHNNKEETDLREARKMAQPVVIQRLFILKETIEEEYLRERIAAPKKDSEPNEEDTA
ncbi:Uncharacterized protein EJ110_NYTH02990 [Nymphaea thermarum]|nr:Uncharacterized protein EJ110_NYTH02990 [Nymphaea thermarum]